MECCVVRCEHADEAPCASRACISAVGSTAQWVLRGACRERANIPRLRVADALLFVRPTARALHVCLYTHRLAVGECWYTRAVVGGGGRC